MAEKEEIIFIDLIKGGCAECPHEYGNCERCYYRKEAIERMAKAICKISCACKYYACGNCTEFLEHYTPDLAEAALNALLGGK